MSTTSVEDTFELIEFKSYNASFARKAKTKATRRKTRARRTKAKAKMNVKAKGR